MTRRDSLLLRCYRAGVALYPRDFRRRFGDELVEFARANLAEARSRGRVAVASLGLRLAVDLARTLPTQWLAAAHGGVPAARFAVERLHTPASSAYPRNNMDILANDLRFALRSLARRPAFTIVAALTLALGIGANTAIFSVVNAVLLRPLPFDDPSRLTMIWGTAGAQTNLGVSYADYVDWRRLNHSYADMGVMRGQSVNVTGSDVPDRMIGEFASASLLRTLGVAVARGRSFTDAETEQATTAPVAMVSYEAWRTRFGGDPSLLGRTLTINGTPLSVIGILAPNTHLPLGATADILLPIGYYPNAHGLDRGTRGVWVVGRLLPGVSLDAARRDLSSIEARLATMYPATNAGTDTDIHRLTDDTVGPVRERLLLILGAVAIVLLIACANVANLQLARGAMRSRELSVRAALGAGRGRIAQQLFTESLVLATIGGSAGVVLASALVPLITALLGPQLPVDDPSSIHLDARALAFALAASIASGVLFGLVPAWKTSRTEHTAALRTRAAGGLRHAATRSALVVAQLALSLALLASAGLLARSLLSLVHVDPGFDGSHLLTAQFRLSPSTYDTPAKIWTMFDRTIAEIRAIPGVESAALVRASPLSGNGETYAATVVGHAAGNRPDTVAMQLNAATPDYFATMRIPIVAGRDVATTDRIGTQPVIVVNRAFAEHAWPNESAIGKQIEVGSVPGTLTIVGVVGDARHYRLDEQPLLQGYIPYAQLPQVFTSVVVRTRGDPLTYTKAVRDAIWRVDRNQPVWRFRSMEQDLGAVVASSKTMMWLVLLFAGVALVVAGAGVYGVMSYTMSQRTHEVGIRMALGASSRGVARMVVGEGARLIAVGIVVGLGASLAGARLLRSQLYGVGPNDVVTFAIVTIVLSFVALAACYLPARKASKVDPMTALRTE